MMNDNEVYGLAVSWLCNLKNDLIKTKGEGYGINTGYLASTRYIDRIITTLMEQQSRIADLENQLEIVKDYASDWGDFFGYTPQELSEEEQIELRNHMKIFEKKWKKKMEEEEKEMTILKPCPFCGENGEEIQDRSYYIPHGIYIGIFYCSNCGGAMIDTDKSHCWLDRAKLWNNRYCADGEKR